jgi:ADP-ribose pyrophosphatase
MPERRMRMAVRVPPSGESFCDHHQMWERQDERVLFSGYRTLVTRSFATPDGVRDFEIEVKADVAVVVALTPSRKVVLVREFRPGVEQWLLELPGGNVDSGEDPSAAAARELLEETGFQASLRYVGSIVADAYSTSRTHLCVGDDARQLQRSAEGLEVALLSVSEFREHLRTGRLTDVGPGYLALDALDLL